MSGELNEDLESPFPESPSQHTVDGAIVHARSRLSLLKDQLAYLSLEVLRSTDEEADKSGTLLNKTINASVDAQSSPRSSVFSVDIPETTAITKGREKPSFRGSSHEESLDVDSQYRGSEAETYSDDHEQYQSVNEIQDGSSCSSRSWSAGRSIAFGVSASDQVLLRNLARSSSARRRYEAPSPSDLPEDHKAPRRKDEDAQSWVLNSLIPFSCWPKEEATADFRVPGRDGSFKNTSSRANKINSGVRVPLLSQAVRSAIGKMWDEYCLETAQDICQLVTEFLMNEDEGRIDPECCWISGRAVYSSADGLPFAFTIHTFSSICKPCTFGHANVLAEITAVDQQTSGAIQKSRVELEQRAYGLASTDSYCVPEQVRPPVPRQWDSLPPPGPHPLPPREPRQGPSKETGSESLSTFSFNSVNPKPREKQAESGSTETLSTADLTAFIRNGEHSVNRQRVQRQIPEQHAVEEIPVPAPQPTASELDDDEQRPGVFCEVDLIWEMHYPDYTRLDTVVASRRLHFDETRPNRKTYNGDTDSEDSTPEKTPGHLEEIFRPESPTANEPEHKQALVPYNQENTEESESLRPQYFDSDPWSEVGAARAKNGCLTESMEVNIGDARRRWARITRLSGLIRRMKRLIGNSSNANARRTSPPLPTIHDAQEPEESEGEEGYYTCETHTPAMLTSRSATPNSIPERRVSLPERPKSPDAKPALMHMRSFPEIDRDRHASVDSASGALSERNLLLPAPSSVTSTNRGSSQNVIWEEPRSIKLPVKDMGNGQYLALGHLNGPGQYKLTVKIGKKKVQDVPKTISVVDATTLGSGIGEDGPFFQRPDSPVFPSASTLLSPHPDCPPCHSVSYDPERLEYALKHNHIGHVDMLFIVDCTSSMGKELRQLPSVVEKIEELVKEATLCKRLRMGVIAYRDHHPEDEDNFLLRKQDFTDDTDQVKHFIAGLEADGGDDYPEAMEVAFEEAVDGVRWSLFSARFIVWVGDAPPHGYQGFRHKEALEEEKKFKEAKARLKEAAYAVDVAMMNEASPRQLSSHDRELAEALEACDAIGKFHDKYPLGIPGRVRWEEAVERVASIGVRVIALGLRHAIEHQASSNCLRTVAHMAGGTLLEVATLDASVIGPLTVAIVEQSLDQQLLDEEVCDLILCFKNDFEHQSKEDRRRNLVESMSQAAKQPHRLQFLPAMSPEHRHHHGRSASGSPSHSDGVSGGLLRPTSRSGTEPSSGSVGPLSISKGSFDLTSNPDPTTSGEMKLDTRFLLLGMTAIRFDDRVLDQVLGSLRNKAESISRCLISSFESPEQWLEFHTRQTSDGLYRREKHRVSRLTSPLSLRYIVAVHIMSVEKQ